MQRRKFILTASAVVAAVALVWLAARQRPKVSASNRAGDADKRQSINSDVDAALSRLYTTVSGSRELASKARGILVFPVGRSSRLLGRRPIWQRRAARGPARLPGTTATAAGSFGLQIGAQVEGDRLPVHDAKVPRRLPQQPGLGRRRRRDGCRGEGGRERQHRFVDGDRTDRSVRDDERRADGRRVAGRHEGHEAQYLTLELARLRPGWRFRTAAGPCHYA